jgi:polyene glycosyltransferase
LFVSYPESGLMNPLLTLVGELARRGVEDLWFATDEPRRSDIEQRAGMSMVQFASLGEEDAETSSKAWDDETYRDLTQPSRFKAHRAFIRKSFEPRLWIEKYRRLEAAVDKIQPALMVIDSLSQFAVELAITRKIPFVLSVPFLPSNLLTAYIPFAKSYTSRDFPVPHSGLPLDMSVAQRVTNRLFRLRTLAMALSPTMGIRILRNVKACKELGITRGPMAKIEAAEMLLCYSVPDLDYPFPIPAKMHLVGAMVPPLPQAPDDDLTEWLNAQNSVIFMGFGTITRLTREQVGSLVDVARRLDGQHQILWKLPSDQQEFLPRQHEIPDNLRIQAWVPSQLDVLAHQNVKLFFNHAGGNGFLEGLYFGKPLVVKPLWMDCHDQAVRGQESGISLTLDRPETIDPDDVVDKLTRVLDDSSFRERAEHFGELLREAGGRRAAADLVLGLPALV